MLRTSTIVPTFSILLKQVTGELITSLDSEEDNGDKKVNNKSTSTDYKIKETVRKTNTSSSILPGSQPVGGGRSLPVQEGNTLQLDVNVV